MPALTECVQKMRGHRVSGPSPLQYDTAGGQHVLWPVLWLVMLIAVPGLFDSVITLWYTASDFQGVRQWTDLSARLHQALPDPLLTGLLCARVPLAILVMVRASAGLVGRSLLPLRRATLLLATISVGIAVETLISEWASVESKSLRLERHVQMTLLRAAPAIEATVLPVAASVLLWLLTRPPSPKTQEGIGHV